MVTIKSFTDLKQSRKLAEILPLESADMHYCLEKRDVATGYEIGITPFIKAKSFIGKCNIIDVQPAWSLAALLGVLPIIEDYHAEIRCINNRFCCCYTHKHIGDLYWKYAGNPIDACYEMILKLHELKIM